MKLLILGILAIMMLSAASGFRRWADSDCYWGWRYDARERIRERSRELREELHARRDAARAEARRRRDEFRREMDDFRDDWR